MEISHQLNHLQVPVIVIKLPQGPLNAANAHGYRDQIALISQDHPSNFLLDLSSVDFIDSTGISALLSTLRGCRSTGGQMKLSGLCNQAKLILSLLGLEPVFSEYPSVTDALSQFTSSGSDVS